MFGMFGMPPGGGVFEAHYRAMPVAFIDKQQDERYVNAISNALLI